MHAFKITYTRKDGIITVYFYRLFIADTASQALAKLESLEAFDSIDNITKL